MSGRNSSVTSTPPRVTSRQRKPSWPYRCARKRRDRWQWSTRTGARRGAGFDTTASGSDCPRPWPHAEHLRHSRPERLRDPGSRVPPPLYVRLSTVAGGYKHRPRPAWLSRGEGRIRLLQSATGTCPAGQASSGSGSSTGNTAWPPPIRPSVRLPGVSPTVPSRWIIPAGIRNQSPGRSRCAACRRNRTRRTASPRRHDRTSSSRRGGASPIACSARSRRARTSTRHWPRMQREAGCPASRWPP